jgi:polyisoprenoid-binding protein YceI
VKVSSYLFLVVLLFGMCSFLLNNEVKKQASSISVESSNVESSNSLSSLYEAGFIERNGQYKVDTKESRITWRGKKAVGEHFGYVNFNKGSFTIDEGEIVNGNFVADLNSITVEDLVPENGEKLGGHLRSSDFFHVEEFPFSTFKITDVRRIDKNSYEVNGSLTIKGQSRLISFPIHVTQSGSTIHVQGKFTFDRTHFDITYMSQKVLGYFVDKFIYDEVEVKFEVFAAKVKINGFVPGKNLSKDKL